MSVHVVRHASDGDAWEFVHAAPDPRLRGFVGSYCAYDERTSTFTRRRELPAARIVLIVNLGEPILVRAPGGAWSEHDSFVAGVHDTYALTETRGAQRGLQVDLVPGGAQALLGVAMHELAAEVVTLEALYGRAGVLLREALAAAPGWAERFALLDAFFLARLDDAFSPVPSVTRALTRLHATSGALPVAVLAAELGCSRRHLTARFREQVGVPPKLYGRILRFRRALALAGTGDWAQIALACGYYDQAHLIRDFNQFAGGPPTDVAARMNPDGGGVRA